VDAPYPVAKDAAGTVSLTARARWHGPGRSRLAAVAERAVVLDTGNVLDDGGLGLHVAGAGHVPGPAQPGVVSPPSGASTSPV
jgi:hypothetical protein